MRISFNVVLTTVLFMWAPNTFAGVLSLLSAPPNTINDKLQDRSWGNVYVDQSQQVVEVYGLARIDKINNLTPNQGGWPDNSVWLVFSFKQAGSFQNPNNISYLSSYVGWTQHSVASVKTLNALLGVSDIDSSTAVMALVELSQSPASGSALASLVDDTAADLSSAFSQLKSLIALNQARWLAAFGFSNSQDVVLVEPFSGNSARELLALSVVDTNGLNISDFKGLFTESAPPVFYPDYEFASLRFITVTDHGDGKYTDQGTVILNYVPEPSSLGALLGLVVSALGWYGLRQRKR